MRTEKPITGTGHAADFARLLRDVRAAHGTPRYRDMAHRAQCSSSALSQAAAGNRLPTLPVVHGFLRGLGCDSATAEKVEARWHAAQNRITGPALRLVPAPPAATDNRATPRHPGQMTAGSASIGGHGSHRRPGYLANILKRRRPLS